MKKLFVAVAGLGLTAALIYLVFIPVFAGEIILRPFLEIGDFRFHHYGLILGVAILAGYFISRTNSWRFGISPEEIDKFGFWLVLVSFFSARAFFVFVERESYASVTDMLKIWDGGLAMYGAIFGGATFTFLYTRKKAYSFWQLLDVIALGLPLAQAIGRFGNFINYEVYGSVTNLPWRMFVPQTGQYHHPTFLYEAIFNLILFAGLYSFRGRLRPGALALIYLASYSFVRSFLEFVRVDEFAVGSWQVNELVSAAVFCAAVTILVYRLKRAS